MRISDWSSDVCSSDLGALSALVGRVHELGMLRERWATARTGQGQAVFVIGEAGIGKSRLVEALVEHVAQAPHELIRLQCSPYHATSTLHPIIERLRRLDRKSTRLNSSH